MPLPAAVLAISDRLIVPSPGSVALWPLDRMTAAACPIACSRSSTSATVAAAGSWRETRHLCCSTPAARWRSNGSKLLEAGASPAGAAVPGRPLWRLPAPLAAGAAGSWVNQSGASIPRGGLGTHKFRTTAVFPQLTYFLSHIWPGHRKINLSNHRIL